MYVVEWWQEVLVKGKFAVAVAGRMCIDGCEVICRTMKEVVGVDSNDVVWEEFYPNDISCRKWRS